MNIGTLTVLLTANTVGLNKAVTAMHTLGRASNAATANINTGLADANKAALALGRNLTQFVTLPVMLMNAVTIKAFAAFEFHLAKIEGLAGQNVMITKAWGEEMKMLSGQVGIMSTQLADAMYFITSSGFEGQEAMEILRMSAKAASTGLAETKQVADVVTSAISAYGKGALSAAYATDILIETVKQGKGETESLTRAMGVAVPTASKLGVSFAQVGASIAAMTRVGTTAQTAAVQLRQLFFTMLKPSVQAKDAIARMGGSFDELKTILSEQGLLAMLDKVKELTKGNASEMALLVPNIRAFNAMLELTGKNAEEVADIFDAVQNSTGALQKAVAAISNTAQHRLNKIMGELNSRMIELGEYTAKRLIPILESLVDIIDFLVRAWGLVPEPIKAFLFYLTQAVAIIGPITLLIKGFGAAFSFVGVSIANMIPVFKGSMIQLGAMAIPLNAIIAVIAAVVAVIGVATYNLLKSSEATGVYNDAMKQAAVSTKAYEDSQKALVNIVKSSEASYDDKTQALKELQKLSDGYLDNLTVESVLLGDANVQLARYVSLLQDVAKGKAAAEAKEIIKRKEYEMMASGKTPVTSFGGIMKSPFATGGQAARTLFGATQMAGAKPMYDAIMSYKEYNGIQKAMVKINEDIVKGLEARLETELRLDKIQSGSANELAQLKSFAQQMEAARVEMANMKEGTKTDAFYSYGVALEQVTAKIKMLSATKGIDEEATIEQIEAYEEMITKLNVADEIFKALGASYDVVGTKLSTYNSMLQGAFEGTLSLTEEKKAHVVAMIKSLELQQSLAKATEERANKLKTLKDSIKEANDESLRGIAINEMMVRLSKEFGVEYDAYADVLSRAKSRLKELIALQVLMNQQGTANLGPGQSNIDLMAKSVGMLEFGMKMTEVLKEDMDAMFAEGLQELLNAETVVENLDYVKTGFEKVETISKRMTRNATEFFRQLKVEGKSLGDALKETFLSMATLEAAFVEQIKNGIKELANSVVNIFVSIGEGIGNALAGSENPFDVLVQSLLNTVKSLGKIAIVLGGIMILMNPLLAPLGIGLIAGGIALTALAQYGTAKTANKGKNMAQGGIVPSGYPNDTFQANLSSNEAVIPLQRLPQLMGITTQTKEKEVIEFVMDGRVAKALVDDARMIKRIK